MSLLLDARKKSQLTCLTQGCAPGQSGLNPFAKKLRPHRGIKRNIVFSLSGTVVLLAAGSSYLGHTEPASPLIRSIPAATMPRLIAAPSKTKPQSAPAIVAANTADHATLKQTTLAELPVANKLSPRRPIHIEPQQNAIIDPLLNNAYLAYRNGKPDEARQLYREMLTKDAHNTDALLGLAAIAQQSGDEILAARYYARVLAMDPRSAAANAGMSALSTDEHNESHLKTLLGEQNDSAALHFALANHYAGQSRWGEAQQSYFTAYTLESDNAKFAFNLAVSLDHLGQNKLAAQYYLQAMQLDQAQVNPAHSADLDHKQIEQRLRELTL